MCDAGYPPLSLARRENWLLTVRFQERDVADLGDWSVVDCLSHGLIHSAMLVEQLLLEGYPIGEDLPNRR
jgi:hypothetical protein